jgi:hypothetical protein
MSYLTDTSSDADAIQIQLLRKATPCQRVAKVRSLSGTVIRLSRRAINRAHPEYSDRDVKLEFVSISYGKTLAEKLRRFLAGNCDDR